MALMLRALLPWERCRKRQASDHGQYQIPEKGTIRRRKVPAHSLSLIHIYGSGIRKPAPVGMEEFIDLFAFVGDLFIRHVHYIHHHDDLRRRRTALQGLKGSDRLRRFVIQQSEILLLQARHGRSRLRRDDYIEVNLIVSALSCRRLLGRSFERPAQWELSLIHI